MSSTPQREQRSRQPRTQVIPIDDVIGNIPPHSTDAEVAVLGAMLIDKDAVPKVVEVLDAECFYHDKHVLIFKAMLAMFERGVTIDLVSLTDQLQRDGTLDRVGGMFALTEINVRTVSAANVEHHARIVLERYLKRQLIKVAGDIIGDCYDDTTDALDEVDRAEQRIFEVAEKRLRRSYSGMKKLTKEAIEKIFSIASGEGDGVTGVPTGFTQLDQLLSGLQPSDLIIVAARPSMGKTAFALSVAREASRRGKSVGIFSLEMSAQQLVLRLISADAQVGLQALRSGRLSTTEMHEIVTRVDSLMNAQIYIDDSAGLTPVEFRAKCRRMKIEHKIDVVIVDYLQLMHAPKAESREREISMISHTLKAVAKELQIPIIALSQLNRTLEARADKRPMLSDLRESGSIEQDADVVMFIHRPEYYKIATFEDGRSTENVAEIIIGKQRNGPTGDVRLFYQKELAAFHDLTFHRDAFDVSPETGMLPPGESPF
ncbi:MAG: replicative DNA helicase [Ignavibacteria bacterium]|nr:replicative DNA helicase [Ignavibacteria bacterium]MBP7093297.1 replicative DNA helicase [Candidatus Kapabacteria bacterium]MBK6419142.1 replicative DNA helicase [Ignavibacteria bacterium]MBK6760168.1 replicative DNA helicase [Ignavibacteria bacterium]MBK7185370.1 replicative DNA helicase [Ignavibacteria bacterium]